MSELKLGRPQSLAGIKDGVLHVQVDLLNANARTIAHGLLGQAGFMVEAYFAEIEIKQQLTAAASANGEKARLDAALAKK